MRPRRRRRPSWIFLVKMAIPLVVVVVLGLLIQTNAPTRPTFSAPFVGTLGTQPSHAQQESDAGVKVAMMEVNWSRWEPVRGQFDPAYERQVVTQLTSLRSAGMRVTLGLGLHYSPQWLGSIPNAHLVDQNGDTSSEYDFTFNSQIRAAADAFLAHANAVLDFKNIWAVRVTSGGRSELLYPGSGVDVWAYGANAQNGPQYPAGLQRNPFPGWRPGESTLSVAQVGTWYQWYLNALAQTAVWQMNEVRSLGFTGYFQVLTPGRGLVPDKLKTAVSHYLVDTLAGLGNAWQVIFRLLAPQPNVVVYNSAMADGTGDNLGCFATDTLIPLTDPQIDGWSSTRWLSRIADAYGLMKAGENPGYTASPEFQREYADTTTNGMLAVVMRQARSCDFQGVYWAHDDQLWNGTVSSELLFKQTTPTAALPPDA